MVNEKRIKRTNHDIRKSIKWSLYYILKILCGKYII